MDGMQGSPAPEPDIRHLGIIEAIEWNRRCTKSVAGVEKTEKIEMEGKYSQKSIARLDVILSDMPHF